MTDYSGMGPPFAQTSYNFHPPAAPAKTYSPSQYKRQAMRNRQRINLHAKRQLSATNRKYITNMNSKVYLDHHRRSSSKDVLIDRPLMSHSLLKKRRNEIMQALSPGGHRKNESPIDYMHGLPTNI